MAIRVSNGHWYCGVCQKVSRSRFIIISKLWQEEVISRVPDSHSLICRTILENIFGYAGWLVSGGRIWNIFIEGRYEGIHIKVWSEGQKRVFEEHLVKIQRFSGNKKVLWCIAVHQSYLSRDPMGTQQAHLRSAWKFRKCVLIRRVPFLTKLTF